MLGTRGIDGTGSLLPPLNGRGGSGAGENEGFTISVVSHRQTALCSHLLADLFRQASPDVARVIVTLNVPEAAPPIDDAPFPIEIVRNERPLGFAANHNRAFRRVRSGKFAVLNPDLRLRHDPFPALARRLQDPEVGLVAPVVLETDGRVSDYARRLVTPWEVIRRRITSSSYGNLLLHPDWLAGMFMGFRSEVFSRLGGFDERYTLYCEDVDLCARVRLAGMQIAVASEIDVVHNARRASRKSLRPLALHVRSLFQLWASPTYRDYRSFLKRERQAQYLP